VPLFELVFLVLVRASKGIPWWKGSPDHFSLRLQAAGFSRLLTDVAAAFVAAVVGIAGMYASSDSTTFIVVIGATVTALVGLGLWLLRFEVRRTNLTSEAPAAPPNPRVLFIHQNFVTPEQGGNARAMHLLSALRRRKIDVDVITGSEGYLGNASGDLARSRTVLMDGVVVHRLALGLNTPYLHARGKAYLKFMWNAARYLRRLRSVDLLLATTPPLPQVMLSIAESYWRAKPLLLEVRDLWPAFLRETGQVRSWPLLKVMEFIEALAYAWADGIVVTAPAFKEYLVANKVPAERILIAPSGAPLANRNHLTEQAAAWRKENGLVNKFVVLYTGSFNEMYDIRRALQAAMILTTTHPDVHWVFVGHGRDQGAISDAAATFPTIHYIPLSSHERIAVMHAAADVGLVSIFPSQLLRTLVPGKLCEYMAAGLPVVSTARGQTAAILKASGGGWICESTDPNKLAEQVARIADMTENERRSIGEGGRDWVLRNLGSAEIADEFAAVAETLIVRAPVPAWKRTVKLARSICTASYAVLTGRTRRVQRSLSAATDAEVEQSFYEWIDVRAPAAMSKR
jgi:glycosyltransferase involved in cell wall biosynthesis